MSDHDHQAWLANLLHEHPDDLASRDLILWLLGAPMTGAQLRDWRSRRRPMRPFCRAHDHREGRDVTCHRMRGHRGPHRMRFDGVRDRRAPIEWYDTVEFTGPLAVAR